MHYHAITARQAKDLKTFLLGYEFGEMNRLNGTAAFNPCDGLMITIVPDSDSLTHEETHEHEHRDNDR